MSDNDSVAVGRAWADVVRFMSGQSLPPPRTSVTVGIICWLFAVGGFVALAAAGDIRGDAISDPGVCEHYSNLWCEDDRQALHDRGVRFLYVAGAIWGVAIVQIVCLAVGRWLLGFTILAVPMLGVAVYLALEGDVMVVPAIAIGVMYLWAYWEPVVRRRRRRRTG